MRLARKRLSAVGEWTEMAPVNPPTDEDKKQVRRAIVILYTCMILGIGLPIVLYLALR